METNAVVGIVAALAGIGALALASSSSTAAATTTTPPATCGTGLPAGYTWELATGAIAPGTHVRISMAADAFATVAKSLGLATTGITGWTTLLSQTQVAQALGTANICAWAPGQALPLDWPASDLDASTEYHADFVYQGAAAITVAQLPFPVSAWAATPPASNVVKTTGPIGVLAGGAGGSVIYPGQVTTYTPPASTNPQTAHLAIPGGNVAVTGTLPGTPITITIDGGGSFVDVAETGTAHSALPPLPFFVYTTPDASGVVSLQWQTPTGSDYFSTVTYS